ncbi:hypothetical protein DFH09DRAFT_1287696 [Mycena vulgaris]|nr:hypothetical protein DFH09DRAFT_1287696 [Mycena vulgaris]
MDDPDESALSQCIVDYFLPIYMYLLPGSTRSNGGASRRRPGAPRADMIHGTPRGYWRLGVGQTLGRRLPRTLRYINPERQVCPDDPRTRYTRTARDLSKSEEAMPSGIAVTVLFGFIGVCMDFTAKDREAAFQWLFPMPVPSGRSLSTQQRVRALAAAALRDLAHRSSLSCSSWCVILCKWELVTTTKPMDRAEIEAKMKGKGCELNIRDRTRPSTGGVFSSSSFEPCTHSCFVESDRCWLLQVPKEANVRSNLFFLAVPLLTVSQGPLTDGNFIESR